MKIALLDGVGILFAEFKYAAIKRDRWPSP